MILAVRDLSKTYKSTSTKALDKVSINIGNSEILGLLGPNGAGKSTLINIIAGLLSADEGELYWEGDILKNHNLLKRKLGLVPQDIALYPKLTAFENLDFLGTQYQIPMPLRHQRISEALKALDLYKERNQLINHFSGGMKRRINLIAGLLHQPELLIMDEPTVGIDVHSKQAIQEFLLKLNGEGMSMLYTSHMMEEAEKICHQVAIIDHGVILQSDSPKNLIINTSGAKNLEDVFVKLTGKGLRN
ncbi:MAG: ABC transporter ATP-binding protein [Bacteroidales bacterium]|nr:ABC transporter ATP-binding protein [Bacteroidales bacterium]